MRSVIFTSNPGFASLSLATFQQHYNTGTVLLLISRTVETRPYQIPWIIWETAQLLDNLCEFGRSIADGNGLLLTDL